MQTVAVIGASADRRKFSNKAVRAYVARGWRVFPVNPKGEPIEGLPTFRSVRDIGEKLDRVTLYLPPQRGVDASGDMAAGAPGDFRASPGAESDALVEESRRLGLDPILACSIIVIGERPSSYSSET